MKLKPSKSLMRWSAAAGVFIVIAFIWCRPLHQYLFKGIPYEVEPHPGIEVVKASPQDCLQLYYKYWLFSEVMAGKIPVFSDPYEFALPGTRGFTSQQFPVSAIFALLKPISPIFAYNVIILLSFVGCGLFMIKLALHKTGDWPAAMIAGLIFCIIPFRPPQLMAGHPNGVAVCFVPLALFLISKAIKTKSLGASVGAGLVYSSIALLDMQLAFFSAMLIALFTLFELSMSIIAMRNRLNFKQHIIGTFRWALPMLISVLPGMAYLLFMKLVILRQSAIHGSGGSQGHIGASFDDIWDITVCGERRIYMGIWTLGLAASGLILPMMLKGNLRERASRLARPIFWTSLAGIGLLLTLSMNPPLNKIIDHIPMARLSRTPSRASIITFTGLCLLAAFGLSCLRQLLSKFKCGRFAYVAVVAIAGTLILHDYWLKGPRGINIIPDSSPVYEQATSTSPDARILAVPLWPGDSSMSGSLFYHISRSRAHLINGYSPVASSNYQDRAFAPLNLINVGQFGQQEWNAARDLNVTHVTFHPESFPAPDHVSVFPADLTLARLKQSPTLSWIMHSDPVDLFSVNLTPETFTINEPVSSPVGFTIPGRYSSISGTNTQDPQAIETFAYERTNPSTNAIFSHHGRILPSGGYDVGLRMKVSPTRNDSKTGITWHIRAFDSENNIDILSKSFSLTDLPEAGQYGWVNFKLNLARAARVGLELTSSSDAKFSLDLWHIVFRNQKDLYSFEAEDLFHAGRVVPNHNASGRGVVQVNQSDPTLGIIRGPYRLLNKGRYIAAIRLRGCAGSEHQHAATIHLSSRTSPSRPILKKLADANWRPPYENASVFDVFQIPFEITDTEVIIECMIDRAQDATLEIDTLSIIPIP